MLGAVITDDYSWACPDMLGSPCYCTTSNCTASKTSAVVGNLFGSTHARTALDLVIRKGSESGVHLPNSVLSQIMQAGEGHIRFHFANTDWTPMYACVGCVECVFSVDVVF